MMMIGFRYTVCWLLRTQLGNQSPDKSISFLKIAASLNHAAAASLLLLLCSVSFCQPVFVQIYDDDDDDDDDVIK